MYVTLNFDVEDVVYPPEAGVDTIPGWLGRTLTETGLRDEVASLMSEPLGLSPQASAAVGYAEMIDHLEGRIDLEVALERIKINTRRLAKKQRTWQRRMPDVAWIDVNEDDTPEAVAERILATVRPD